jgi:hypothetical protein
MEKHKVKFKIKSSVRKKRKFNNKTCKKFCDTIFLPEKERVEIEFSKGNNIKYKYTPIKKLSNTNKTLAKTIKKLYLKACNDIYCQKDCKGTKSKWLKSFTKKRKDTLIQKGATSGCRDLLKEYPEYYKNI